MLKNQKKVLFCSSLLILLPILVGLLLWGRFPERMVTHWSINGQPDGWSSVPFAVLFPPVMMLAVHWLCIWFTIKDPGNKGRNKKPIGMVLWIVPVISNLSSFLMYALALGADWNIGNIMIGALGLMFAVIGNYLPKCKMNSTIGIKIPWTYSSEENWNATHRFGGKIWVIGGILMALSVFLPGEIGIMIMIVAMAILIVLPLIYSYQFYCRQKKQGVVLKSMPKAGKAGVIALVILLVLLSKVLFAGNIDFIFREDYLLIDTNMYSDHVIYYDVIDSVEYREGNVPGMRVGGYGSFRLLMGYFQNAEFGTYIRYTYYKPEACVILKNDDSTLVLSAKDAESTRSLYEELLKHTAK